MILGDLLHLASTNNIGAAIANIGNIGHIPTKHRCNTGRSHATSQHVLRCPLMDQGIGPFDGTQQRGRDFVTVVLIYILLTVSTAISLATSPAAWPPIPSATMNKAPFFAITCGSLGMT